MYIYNGQSLCQHFRPAANGAGLKWLADNDKIYLVK